MNTLTSIVNSGSLYEQLITQVIAVESQPKLKLRTEQTDQTVYKGVLSDFSSRVSSLNSLLEKLQDPFRSPFSARAANVPEDVGFSALAAENAKPGEHEIQVRQLARADARFSKQITAADNTLLDVFVDPGDPGDPTADPPILPTFSSIGERSFTLNIAQPEGDPVEIDVSYTPEDTATNDDILRGVADAITAAMDAARADGLLAEGTGASASVVRETSDSSRLSLRSLATGYGNRISFSDTDGLLAELELDVTSVRSGSGGGAIYAVGSGPEDSDLSAAFTLDGLDIYRDTNTIEDALDGITFTLDSVMDEPELLTIGADTKGMRAEVDAFIETYNELMSFIGTRSTVNAETGERGAFASDTALRGLRFGLRNDLSREIADNSTFSRLADLGIETERDGTLKLTDVSQLDAALAATPDAVGALFSSEDGLGARLTARFDALLGSDGTIEQRKKTADARIDQIEAQIERWDTRLARREQTLRDQFAQLEALTTQAQSQQASLASLFFF
ncbi:MAG: flagellar filament capping protein FliD [Bacteroidota bacterium]